MAKFKTVKAWAVLENKSLACYDYRLPICWDRLVAKSELERMCLQTDEPEIVEVEIHIPIKRKRRGK